MLPIENNKNIKQLVHKLSRRSSKFQEVQRQFYTYLNKMEVLQSKFCLSVSSQLLRFQEQVAQVSLYSLDKCSESLNVSKALRQLCTSVKASAEINLRNLNEISREKVLQQQVKLQNKTSSFHNDFQTYSQCEKQHNKIFMVYSQYCYGLDSILLQFQDYSNPINFYNESATESYLNDLQRRYLFCIEKQSEVVTDRQVLDQKRKWLGEHLKEVTEAYVLLLHHHLARIQNVALLISSKQPRGSMEQIHLCREQNPSLDFQIEEFQHTKRNKIDEETIQDFSLILNNSMHSTELNPDQKIFQDRCATFGRKKLNSIDETIQLRKKLMVQLGKIQIKFNQLEQECAQMERDSYGVGRKQAHQERFRKYFGQNIAEVEQLCFDIIEKPRRSFERINFAIKSQVERLGKSLTEMEQNSKTFGKRMNHLFDESSKSKQMVDLGENSDLSRSKVGIVNSFNEFKSILEEFERTEKEMQKAFSTGVAAIELTINKQESQNDIDKILATSQGKLNVLKSLSVDNQVIAIIKQDTTYQILFSDTLKPDLSSSFDSLIKKKLYTDTVKVLEKKEAQSRNMMKRKIACCGISSEQIFDQSISKHPCSVEKGPKLVSGSLQILKNGLRFKQISYNLFKKTLQLLIPVKQIIDIQQKIQGQDGKQFILLETAMGFISIIMQEKGKNVIEQIRKHLDIKPRSNRDRSNQNVRDRRNESSSSLNKSSDFIISYDGPTSSKSIRDRGKSIQKNLSEAQTLLKNLAQKLKTENFFSAAFDKIDIKKSDRRKAGIRINYDFSEEHTKLKVKQRRSITLQSQVEGLVVELEWKVSFPESMMLNSFRYNERMKIQIGEDSVKVTIETGSTANTQFLKRKFIEEVNRMNQSLSQFIMRHCEREVEVVVEEQTTNDDSSVQLDALDQIEGPFEIKLELPDLETKSVQPNTRSRKRTASTLKNYQQSQ